MIKHLATQALAIALTSGFGISAVRGEISAPAYLSLITIFILVLLISWVAFVRQRLSKAQMDWLRFAQHATFVALLLSINLICADLVLSGRAFIVEPTPLDMGLIATLCLALISTVVMGLTLGIRNAIDTLGTEQRHPL